MVTRLVTSDRLRRERKLFSQKYPACWVRPFYVLQGSQSRFDQIYRNPSFGPLISVILTATLW